MTSEKFSKEQALNRVTVDKLSAMLGRLSEAGALSGRLDHRLIVRRDSLSNELNAELEDLLTESHLIYRTAEWSGSVRLFPIRTSSNNWLFITCGSLERKIYLGGEDPQIEVPFEDEVRDVLRSIRPPRDDAAQALLNLCMNDAWYGLHKEDMGQALRDWLNRPRDPDRDNDD